MCNLTQQKRGDIQMSDLNGYVCFYNRKRYEVRARTSLEAQTAAAKFFKVKKAYQIAVVLAEQDGKPVMHSTASLG